MNRQPIVQLSNLSWTFREGETRRQVLDHITFDFEPGEFVALLGQSGSGKSTLLNLISGIEKPTTGDVTINGFAITQKTERDRTLFRRDQIGIVFQIFQPDSHSYRVGKYYAASGTGRSFSEESGRGRS